MSGNHHRCSGEATSIHYNINVYDINLYNHLKSYDLQRNQAICTTSNQYYYVIITIHSIICKFQQKAYLYDLLSVHIRPNHPSFYPSLSVHAPTP